MTYKLAFETDNIHHFYAVATAIRDVEKQAATLEVLSSASCGDPHSGAPSEVLSFPIAPEHERSSDDAAPVAKRTRRTKEQMAADAVQTTTVTGINADGQTVTETVELRPLKNFPEAEAVIATTTTTPAQTPTGAPVAYADVSKATLDLLRKKKADLGEQAGKKYVLDILEEFGAQTAPNLKPEQYAEYVERCALEMKRL